MTGHRSTGRDLRPRGHELRNDASGVLGESRPDAGHAAGQRRRHPVPVRPRHDDEQKELALRSREAFQAKLSAAGYGEITTEVESVPEYYFAEDYHQQYLAKNPNGYCGLGGTGVSCPIGVDV